MWRSAEVTIPLEQIALDGYRCPYVLADLLDRYLFRHCFRLLAGWGLLTALQELSF